MNNRLASLRDIWIKYAATSVQAQLAGQPTDALQQFSAKARQFGFSAQEIQEIVKQIPCTLADRQRLIEEAYRATYPDIASFHAKVGIWAMQQEMQAVDLNLRGQLENEAIEKLAKQVKAKTEIPTVKLPDPPPPTIENNSTVEMALSSLKIDLQAEVKPALQIIGAAMQDAYKGYGQSIEFDVNASSDRGIRCDRFVFKKPPNLTFDSVEKYVEEVLSHAGIDPDADVIFRRLPNNAFEVHIPRPKEEWKVAHLFYYLTDEKGLRVLSDSKNPGRLGDYLTYVRNFWSVSPERSLSLPFMVDLDGKVFQIDCSSGVLFGGGSNGGKSTGFKLLITLMMMLYPPSWLQIALFDFKNGLTFGKFNGQSWLWGDVVSDPEDAGARFESLADEAKSRAKYLAKNNCENILEYNAQNPKDPLPWLPLGIDEVGAYKQRCPEEADYWLSEILSRWRAYGMPVIASTQYPTSAQSLAPAVRINFGSRVSYKTDESCAEYIFGEKSRQAKAATRLIPPGDCLMKQDGQFFRGQALFIEPQLLLQLLKHFRSLYPAKSSAKQVSGESFAGLLDSPEPRPALKLIANKDDEFEEVRRAIAELLVDLGIENLTARKILIKLWGTNADAGGSQAKNRARLRAIIERNGYVEEDLSVAIQKIAQAIEAQTA